MNVENLQNYTTIGAQQNNGQMTQLQMNHTAVLPKEPPVIDEKAIKSILYLCLKGEVVIQPEEGLSETHSIDTFA